MLKTILAIILAVLVIGGGVGSWLLIDRLYLAKEREAQKLEEEEVPIPVDPSKTAWVELLPKLSEDPKENLDRIRDFLATYPDTPLREEVYEAMNRDAGKLAFTAFPAEWKEPYTVVSGDSLSRISTRTGAPMDWIMKVNNLTTHDLSVGQQLLTPNLDVRLVLSLTEERLFVFAGDELFFAFPVTVPPEMNVSRGEGPVSEKISMGPTGRVAFADRHYAGGAKSVLLSLPGLEFAAMPDPAPDGETAAIPRGILLSTPDMEELFLLVKRGTPVLIQ